MKPITIFYLEDRGICRTVVATGKPYTHRIWLNYISRELQAMRAERFFGKPIKNITDLIDEYDDRHFADEDVDEYYGDEI